MEIAPVQLRVDAADIPPEELAGNTHLTEAQKVGEVARQFESILLRQILKETQQKVFTGCLDDDSTAAGIYQDMVTQQLADSISKSGSFGLAHALQFQLTRQLLPASSAGQGQTAQAPPTAPGAAGNARPFTSEPGPHAAAHINSIPIPSLNIP